MNHYSSPIDAKFGSDANSVNEIPEGFDPVPKVIWETSSDRNDANLSRPLNGHIGIYAWHHSDCWCSSINSYCNRGGFTWSCCGQREQYSYCNGKNMATAELEAMQARTKSRIASVNALTTKAQGNWFERLLCLC